MPVVNLLNKNQERKVSNGKQPFTIMHNNLIGLRFLPVGNQHMHGDAKRFETLQLGSELLLGYTVQRVYSKRHDPIRHRR